MVILPQRLQDIYMQINVSKTQNARIIDVGSDHALFGIYALQNDITPFVIATDINELPSIRSREALEFAGFKDRSMVYHTDGVKGVELKVNDTIIIAGMGGNNIIDILLYVLDNLDESILKTLDIIIQPQKSLDKVREFLGDKGFKIVSETVSYDDNNYYVIFKLSYDGQKYSLTDEELYYGTKIVMNDISRGYYAHLDDVYKLRSRGDSRLRKVLERRNGYEG